MPLSDLEKNILRTKGLDDAQLVRLEAAGIVSKAEFLVVGDAATLASLAGLSSEVASAVMAWAIGAPASSTRPIIVEGADVVSCAHCGARQPKDYHAGDLCPSCGRQAEPIFACYWCGKSGPGTFCRSCGSQFVPTGELDLAVLLRRDGLPKDDIPKKLATMSTAEKDVLWGRIRKSR